MGLFNGADALRFVVSDNACINKPLKIIKIGNSAGVVLPKEMLAHLDAQVGDALSVVRTSRGLELSKEPTETLDQLVVAREVAARRRMALRALADQIMEEDRETLSALAKK